MLIKKYVILVYIVSVVCNTQLICQFQKDFQVEFGSPLSSAASESYYVSLRFHHLYGHLLDKIDLSFGLSGSYISEENNTYVYTPNVVAPFPINIPNFTQYKQEYSPYSTSISISHKANYSIPIFKRHSLHFNNTISLNYLLYELTSLNTTVTILNGETNENEKRFKSNNGRDIFYLIDIGGSFKYRIIDNMTVDFGFAHTITPHEIVGTLNNNALVKIGSTFSF